jgi:hypothetical protein
MVWDWSRGVWLLLLSVLAVAIQLVVIVLRSGRRSRRRGAAALLAMILLGVTGWWIALWVLTGDLSQETAQPPSRAPLRKGSQ